MTNAEKYKTTEERFKALNKWCDSGVKQGSSKCLSNGCIKCTLKWLELEAEEEEPLPCPFCGFRCFAAKSICGKTWRVFCEQNISCAYSSGAYATKDDAIAAHNRVARAVVAAEKKEDCDDKP